MLNAIRHILLVTCAIGIWPAIPAKAQDLDSLAPYKMIRSLQSVQDSIVMGDHAAAEMQRYMLSTIDTRLRAAPASVFDDPRNVDAALIYAMSGGNPETLSRLANADIEGNFDTRVTDAISHYLGGKGGLMVLPLAKIMPEYKNSRLGPYLALVLGNAMAMQDPNGSLKYYDWARLTSPGTNIEEAALRRSLMITTQGGMKDKAFGYALSYARRFLTSPYASQFADVFVELAVANYGETTEPQIAEILGFMDRPRQREVYLRIARRAAIAGMKELTTLASERAGQLSDAEDGQPKALAELYSGLVGVPSTGIVDAVKVISAIPQQDLSSRDLALRDAAARVAQEVLRAPEPASLTQATVPNVPEVRQEEISSADTGSGDSPFAKPEPKTDDTTPSVSDAAEQEATPREKTDPVFDAFLSAGNSKLDEIDALLKGEK